ncbi:MAG: sulfatase-like hydrolase/transferase [Acidobacteria bacterium]|nr:sulfatase-like hydrolase/transferase [Acidobacteriota bacterium]
MIHRRHFLQLAPATLSARSGRPNVLFLFTDDQRADTISALGNPYIRTPHLDSLVRRGFTFSNAYCMGGNSPAVCTPSRNMLLSGRAFFRFGQLASGDDPNFPVAMKELGYETYHHGKRGNTATLIQAKFDHNKYLSDNESRTSGEPGKDIADGAIDFLRRRKQDRPFFLYLAFSGPHDPRVAASRYMQMYDPARIPLPANYLPIHPFDNGEQTVRDELLAPWPRTESEIRKHLHDYYAVITAMDGHIGRLLEVVPRNTIIVFSSDHGLAIGSHGLMGKQSLYEAAMKPPLIFAGPGIRRGRSPALVYLLDIFPTVVDMVGGQPPAGLDGKSLKLVIEGRSKGVRDTLFLAYRDVQRAIRDERWKLIRYPHINRTQLFDLATDPYEKRNLADEPGQQARIGQLLEHLRQWQQRLGDKTPLTSANPRDPVFVPPR